MKFNFMFKLLYMFILKYSSSVYLVDVEIDRQPIFDELENIGIFEKTRVAIGHGLLWSERSQNFKKYLF